MSQKVISILIACYYSEQTLSGVVSEIQSVFAAQSTYDYQLILVNDGSTDGTFRVASEVAKKDDRIIAIDLSKNYGQLCAKMAGHQYVTGDYLVYMDDDGQHPASAIFTLVKALDEYDVVYANFEKKQYAHAKSLASRIHGYLMYKSLGKPKNVKISSFYAINRMMIEALKHYDSPFASPIGYMLQVTQKIGNIPIEHRQRIAGSSGYTFRKMVRQWYTVFTSFSAYPLHVARKLGFLTTVCGLLMAIICLIFKLINGVLDLLPYVNMALHLFIGGIILLFLGLLGDYVGRIYMILSKKPQYFIRSVNGQHLFTSDVEQIAKKMD